MKVKVSELSGAALDWAVAICCGEVTDFESDGITYGFKLNGKTKVLAAGWAPSMSWQPSTDWAQGGPIIEREAQNLFKHNGGTSWCAAVNVPRDSYTAIVTADGPTPLIAAMRCYVASKLGDEVEIPEELV